MNNKPKIFELAAKALRQYDSATDYCEFNSDIPKAIRFYYCEKILSAVVKNKKNWETVLCDADIEYIYANGTPKQIKIMSFYVDAFSDPE